MKQPLKYNWYALISLTILVMTTFFVALTGWHIGPLNEAEGPATVMAGEALPSDGGISPAGTGKSDVDGGDGVRSRMPEVECLKPADWDSLSALAADCADFWLESPAAQGGIGNDSTGALDGNQENRQERELIRAGVKNAGPGIADGSGGGNGGSTVRPHRRDRSRLDDMTDGRISPH